MDFFFFKQKTAYEMRISDWSSDVCSSDLFYPDHPELVAAVRHHHEQIAGTGYPDGLKNGQIDELSLVTAVVDVYSALTDRRDYKEPMPARQALTIMDGMAGPPLEPRMYRR